MFTQIYTCTLELSYSLHAPKWKQLRCLQLESVPTKTAHLHCGISLSMSEMSSWYTQNESETLVLSEGNQTLGCIQSDSLDMLLQERLGNRQGWKLPSGSQGRGGIGGSN